MKGANVEAKGEISTADGADEATLVGELFDYLGTWAARYDAARASLPEASDAAALSVTSPVLAEVLLLQRGRNTAHPAIDGLPACCYAERRLRDRLFADDELFGEPAWDILLDVASAESKGERLPVTSVCIGACVPGTTALRWIDILERRGLLHREDDRTDARRSFVRLTTEGARKLERYFIGLAELRRRAQSRNAGRPRLAS